ncbi:MAG: zinc ribbon domain-containing protein [Clostridia bacterium]|nr:zinc ribbon domain-containing protein [Clostridia bacterium]
MSICPNCNTNLPDGASFCASCGTKIGTDAPQQAPSAPINGSKLHCPNCKSHNLTVTTESSITGAVSTHSHGGRFSSTHVSNNHQTFWICGDCGTKFRNIQSLEEEIIKYKNQPLLFFIVAAIAAIISVVWFINSQNSPVGFLFGGMIIITAICAIVFVCIGFSWRGKLAKMKAELADLKNRCFN